MSFDALETSISDSLPIRLYDFSRDFVHWRFTSADRDIVYGVDTYMHIAISDSGNQETGDAVQETFTITAPADFAVAALFAIMPPSGRVLLRVSDLHQGDDEARLYWLGQISKVSRPIGSVSISCESIVAAQQTLGLRLSWQRGCPHTVYDLGCTVDPEPLRVPATLTAVSETQITSADLAAFDNGYFAGGFVRFESQPGIIERRGVELHVGSVLSLLGSTYPMAVGQTVDAFPGCDNSPATCNDRFHNLLNYGGIPGLPGDSPFENSPFI